MTRSKRIQEDTEKKEGFFPKVADDVLTKKDNTPKKYEVPIDENSMLKKKEKATRPQEKEALTKEIQYAYKEGGKEVLTPPQVSVPFL